MSNYYKHELDNLFDSKDEYPLSFQIHSSTRQTKWLNLNAESIAELRKFLTKLNHSLKEEKTL